MDRSPPTEPCSSDVPGEPSTNLALALKLFGTAYLEWIYDKTQTVPRPSAQEYLTRHGCTPVEPRSRVFGNETYAQHLTRLYGREGTWWEVEAPGVWFAREEDARRFAFYCGKDP